jgi:hypothetical protein
VHGSVCDGRDDHQRLISREATAADIQAFYAGRPHPTLRARVVTSSDGEVLGVIGLAREGPWSKFFSEIREALRASLSRAICLRTILKSMDYVRASKLPVFAIAQADEPDSHRVLQRLGFVQVDGDVYRWPT